MAARRIAIVGSSAVAARRIAIVGAAHLPWFFPDALSGLWTTFVAPAEGLA